MAAEMTFTRCTICQGTLEFQGDWPNGKRPCPCTRSKTPGWSETGITLGQIDRAVAAEEHRHVLIAAMEKIAELEGDCEHQQFVLTRFQASQIARKALNQKTRLEGI